MCMPRDLFGAGMHLQRADVRDLNAVKQSGVYGLSASLKEFLSHRGRVKYLVRRAIKGRCVNWRSNSVRRSQDAPGPDGRSTAGAGTCSYQSRARGTRQTGSVPSPPKTDTECSETQSKQRERSGLRNPRVAATAGAPSAARVIPAL